MWREEITLGPTQVLSHRQSVAAKRIRINVPQGKLPDRLSSLKWSPPNINVILNIPFWIGEGTQRIRQVNRRGRNDTNTVLVYGIHN